jgi:biopolymer transport protein ExbB/TolQ
MRWIIQGGFFMLPLTVCSVLVGAIVLERFRSFARIMKTPLIEQERPAAVMKNLRRYLPVLQTIITITPMLGLMGTVTGLMRCFHLLGKQVAAYDPVGMSLGISEALITTAAGLFIAVIATIFYNYFIARMNGYYYDYENALLGDDADEATD